MARGPKISRHTRGGYYTTLTVAGKKKFIYGKTESEVMDKYIEAKYKAGQGYNIVDEPLMGDYCRRWFDLYKRGKKSISTQEMYAGVLNAHILPALGSRRVKDIVASDIQMALNNANTSKSLAHKVRITFKQIFDSAIADRLIAINPVVGTEPVKTPEPVREFYTPEQRAIMMEILADTEILPLVYTVLHTGLRATEAVALMRGRDLDLDHNLLKVVESTQFNKNKPLKKDTKTWRGVREIPIPAEFADWMRKYLREVKSLYVFPGDNGGQMKESKLKSLRRWANRRIEKYFDATPEQEEHRFSLKFKTLRHTYCTELYDLGIDEVSAAGIMGHSVTVMREIYTHIQKSREVKTAILIDDLYKGKNVDLQSGHRR